MPKATPQGAPEGPGRADVPRRACQAARIRELVDRFESVPSATSSTAQDQALGSQRKAPQGARRASLPPSMPSGTGGATTSRSVSGPSSQLPGRAFSIAVGSRNDPPLEEEDIVVASPLDTAGGDGPSPSERSGAEPQQRPHVEAALGRMDWSPRYGLGQSFQDEPGKPRGVDHAKASSPGSPATPLASNTRSMFLPSNRDAREAGHTSSRALSSAFFTGQRQTQVHAHSMPLRSVDPQPVKERQQAQLDKSQAAQRRAEEREQRNAPSHLPVTQVRVQSDALPFDPVSARLVKPSARPVHAHGTPAIGNIPIELRGAERPYKVRLPSSGEDSPFSRFRDETGGDWLEGARRRPVQQGRPTDRQPTHAESRPEISAKSGVRDGLPASGEKLPFSLGKGRKDGLKGATGQTTAGLPDRGDSSSAGSEVSPNRHSLPEDHPKDPFADQDGDATGKPQAPSTYPLAESATGADRFSPPGRKHMLDFDSTLKYRPSDDLDSSPSPGCSLGRSTVDTPCEGMYQEEDEEGLPFFDRGSTSPSSRGADERSSETLCLRPAAEVFGAKAAPLHLPALDAYLSDKKRFPEPRFTDPRLLCTLEERMLFGYDAQPEATGRQGKRKIAKLEVVGGQIKAPAYALLDTKTGPKSSRSAVGPKAKRDQGQEEVEEVEEEEEAKASLVEPNSISTLTGVTGSTGVSSSFSSASKPATRLEMFPPLMLLRDHSLDELKSNAVGPRAPPGGMLGSLPPLGSILGTVLDFLIGIEGSSFAAGIVRLEVFRDFAQMMALNLHFNSATSASDSLVRRIFLHIIPSLLAFDFVSVFGQSIIFLCAWMALTGLALWYFWRMTRVYDPNRDVEGFESQPWIFTSPARGTKAANITIVFILTSLYLPLSKLAVDALLWKSDFWPVANPYADGNDNPDQSSLPSLGDPDVYRGPLDFCYTTTMRRDAFNFAWIVVPLAVLTLCGYTLWFPYRMWRTVHEMLPHVSEYNELGQRRSSNEMEIEYQRLLGRDKSPLNFFYNGECCATLRCASVCLAKLKLPSLKRQPCPRSSVYRRQWGGYKSIYMLCFKLTNLLVITTFAKDNCLFRTKPTKTMLIVQQSVLIVLMSLLLGIHLWLKPFIDALSNRSEMVSRWGYVCTAVIGLLVALRVSGSSVYNTTILYLVQGVTYAGNIYLALAGTSLLQHFVKRMQKRIDFSKRLDTSRCRGQVAVADLPFILCRRGHFLTGD